MQDVKDAIIFTHRSQKLVYKDDSIDLALFTRIFPVFTLS